ncbi:MAG: hypothetical protein CDV28_1525 [Candidatus Electronema aureum]|uniref:Porin n=1 Tax=Candidatus Electronema aureum TaxID=2005002 RepID=A0A521FYN3_9BACT|nr:MAG: hypothetical protein CDV28_1525 [Candidatus Electronema aureum]
MKKKIAALLLCALPPAAVWAADEKQTLAERLYDKYEVELLGFAETRVGARLVDDEHEDAMSIGEARTQLRLSRDFDSFLVQFKGDLLADAVTEELDADIRELNVSFRPTDWADVKIGRMVSTWGTGDMIFINDMFPKDWQSFFIGRDDEYLKQASNVIKTGFFFGDYSLDLVYAPLFQGSEYIDGERLSYYNPSAGRIVGQDMVMEDSEPDRWFRDDELSMRLSRSFAQVEAALYAYSGFWQEPEGMDMASGKAVYPPLNVYGASARSPMFGGIGNAEFGYYDSTDDESGSNPAVRPSEFRILAGFEREIGHELTGSVQYYIEAIDGYDDYEQALPPGMKTRDEYRHLLTLRLTKLMMNQNLTLSLFAYYSPTDNDGNVRPKVKYKLNDHWQLDGGLNFFFGDEEHTFWGRFQDNSNAFVGLRYNF